VVLLLGIQGLGSRNEADKGDREKFTNTQEQGKTSLYFSGGGAEPNLPICLLLRIPTAGDKFWYTSQDV